jgi:hypothetical protein
MGIVHNLMPNPGTEVPGYFHVVPTGRKMTKLQGARLGMSIAATRSLPSGKSRTRFAIETE